MPSPTDPALATTLAGISLRNPVLLAAGTAGNLDEIADVLDLSQVGGVVAKSVTRAPREGNDAWRVADAGPAGMLNAVGLANVGIDSFVEHLAPRIADVPTVVLASIAGFSVDEYVRVAAALDEWAHDKPPAVLPGVEVNVSCPNVRTGTEFGGSPHLLRELLGALRPVLTRLKMIVKLGPMTPELRLVARAAIAAGADALTVANTMPAMAIDVRTRRPRLANVTGGLSGPGVHPVAVRLVHEVYTGGAREAGVPVIGCGGVLRWEDAAEFILAGATCVQMGTALFVDPRLPIRVAKGLGSWVRAQGCGSIRELVGAVRLDG